MHDTTALVNTIIGTNFVPAYPLFVLSIIQAKSSMTPIDTSTSSHGYYYELLIRAALAHSTTKQDYDIAITYLTNLASVLRRENKRSVTTERLATLHTEFENKVDLDLNLEDLMNRMTTREILIRRADEISFRYEYLYYYFSALNLKDTLHLEETRAQIRAFSSTLHLTESANILLFLAHLTKDPFVVETLLTTARSVFSDAAVASLEATEAVEIDLSALDQGIRVFLDRDVEKSRKEMLEELDSEHDKAQLRSSEQAEIAEPTEALILLGQALASLQLLGQVVKNFPSLEGDRKLEIVSESYLLGRRILGWYLSLVQTHNVPLIEEVAMTVKQVHPSFKADRALERAQAIVATLVAMATFGVVKRVSLAVGSQHLDRTYRRAYDEKIPAVRLFDFSIQLDHAGAFPLGNLKDMANALQKNPLSTVILRALVTQHLHLFKVPFQIKQAACETLGMKYQKGDLPFSDVKLLP